MGKMIRINIILIGAGVISCLALLTWFVLDYVDLQNAVDENTQVVVERLNKANANDQAIMKFVQNQRFLNDVTIRFMNKQNADIMKQCITEVRDEISKIQRSGDGSDVAGNADTAGAASGAGSGDPTRTDEKGSQK